MAGITDTIRYLAQKHRMARLGLIEDGSAYGTARSIIVSGTISDLWFAWCCLNMAQIHRVGNGKLLSMLAAAYLHICAKLPQMDDTLEVQLSD